MKILIASTHVPPETAGAEKVAWETARRLAKNHEVHVLTTTRVTGRKEGIKIHRIPLVPFPTIFYGTIGWPMIKDLAGQFDIIHSHMPLPWGFLFRNSKTKKVITMHGCEYLNKGLLFKILAKLAFKGSNLLISPSHWLRKYVQKRYGYDSEVVPNGIDTSKFRAYKGLRKKNVVLFIGRLMRIKGVMELIEAAKRLPQYEFWFAGKGPLEKELKLPNTKYFGQLDEDGLIRLFNQATICVFPSYNENFPVVGLEALSCGTATIASTTGFSEIIDHNKNGILVEPKDASKLVTAIVNLMGDAKLRKRFEKEGRKKALNFDYKVIMKKHYSLYRSVLDGN